MSMAYGFYWGVFYPVHSPPYEPPGGGDDPAVAGSCFAPVGQPEDYKGFLFNTAELRSDYILYA